MRGRGGESKEREGREEGGGRRGAILLLYIKYIGATGQLDPRMH